jgi:hypothetical protein
MTGRILLRLLLRPGVVASLVVAAVVAVACEDVDDDHADVGDPCAATGECRAELECVVATTEGGSCLPIPQTREPLRCATSEDCGQAALLWPVEAVCERTSCRCPLDLHTCSPDLVFDPDVCLCVEPRCLGVRPRCDE